MCEYLLTLDVQAVGVFDMYGRIQNFINHLKEEEREIRDCNDRNGSDPTAL